MSDQEVSRVAEAFLDGICHDLNAFGGVKVTRIDPLRRSKAFAISVFDAVAVMLARRYQEGVLDYEMADWVANTVEGEMIDLMVELQPGEDTIDTPQDWSEVYEAFDSGEFDHFGRSKDPVAEYTNPGIKAFLDRIDGVR